jgi:hypothetical protein
MEALSQLDVTNPDHVSVITRDGRVTVSVLKDGTSVTLGFTTKEDIFNTTPRPPLQQPAPQMKAVRDTEIQSKYQQQAALAFLEKMPAKDQDIPRKPSRRNFRNWNGPSKLDTKQVKEIRMYLADESLRKSCGTITNFYNVIGRKFGVTGCSISNIARGIAWRGVK